MLKKKYNGDEIQNKQIKKLYNIAKSVANPKKINEQNCFGRVGPLVLTKQGNIYTGVCIDTDCSLGMCAERNALSTMITNGEIEIDSVIAVNYMGKVSPIDYMQTEIENDNGQKLPIMNFKMKLEHSVREDIYEYFVG